MKTVKRAVLFGIDGAGAYFEQADTPNLDRIFKNGAVSRRTLTELPSISAQCWGSMLHGVECARHGLTNSIADEIPYPLNSPYPSVFRIVREAMPEAKLASFCDWGSVNIGIIEDGIDVYKYNAPDHELIEPAVEYINKNDLSDSQSYPDHKRHHNEVLPDYHRSMYKSDQYKNYQGNRHHHPD